MGFVLVSIVILLVAAFFLSYNTLLHDCFLVVNENTTCLVVTGVQTIVQSFHCNIEVLCMVLGLLLPFDAWNQWRITAL